MYLDRNALSFDVKADVGDTHGEYDVVLFTKTPWDGVRECRVTCSDGVSYSCLIKGDEKMTPFVKVNIQSGGAK